MDTHIHTHTHTHTHTVLNPIKRICNHKFYFVMLFLLCSQSITSNMDNIKLNGYLNCLMLTHNFFTSTE